MVRAWLISDEAARRWVEGWADDVDLLAGELAGQPACLFEARLEGRRELVRVGRSPLPFGCGGAPPTSSQ